MIEKQIELEKQMTQRSIDSYRKDFERAKQSNQFGTTSAGNSILVKVLADYREAIESYVNHFKLGKAIKNAIAAETIAKLDDLDAVAVISAKTILNAIWSQMPFVALCKAVGQSLEDEFKMRECKKNNEEYYKSIQKDLIARGAKSNRRKYITTGVFRNRMNFHIDKWTVTEKFNAGHALLRLFSETTGLSEVNVYRKTNSLHQMRVVEPTETLIQCVEAINGKLELLQPLFLPMVAPPKDWTDIFEGGYLSPYLKRNKLVKNNDKPYLNRISKIDMPIVYEAINHLQATAWRINTNVLEVFKVLWDEGKAVAELPDREDEPLIPFPYPDLAPEDAKTDEQVEVIKGWKRAVYETHKRNVQKRSVRILVSQILNIANQFKDYEKIYFPYQMDFRGRLYPIPVLLQPQGTDLAKGLLQFAEGKAVDGNSIKWLEIHGANMYGYDKESYDDRIKWVQERTNEIKSYAENPLENRGWTEADKPFQFLAFCLEYTSYLTNPDTFKSYIPVQLDGTCNGLQHYSALLRDKEGGKAVNLINSNKPNDIYKVVAERLIEKLKKVSRDKTLTTNFAKQWLDLGINRKLTKRPVMVLPYGGTILSCREYIQEYLTDTYSTDYLWKHFNHGQTPTDCIFRVSTWLSKYLWQSIQEVLQAATTGMSYLRKVVKIVSKDNKRYLEWYTPAGLLVHQGYCERKRTELRTELYGKVFRTLVNFDLLTYDAKRQLNGICPNFIHSLDASCLMLYLIKCKKAGINSFMAVHDSYGTHAADTELSAKFLRESFVEIYRQPILERITEDLTKDLTEEEKEGLPELPERGDLDIEEVLNSEYFFN